ncbi:hypothetical protein FQN54_009974 [Arachnomyces sp. PD_36]|nr:hypothetical protein FQN54_009974 [Arachnomyces sp. PD_36]
MAPNANDYITYICDPLEVVLHCVQIFLKRRQDRRSRGDVEMGVRHGKAMEDILRAQKETNKKLDELSETVAKLVHEGQAREYELALLRAEVAREKERRRKEEWEVERRKAAKRDKEILRRLTGREG